MRHRQATLGHHLHQVPQAGLNRRYQRMHTMMMSRSKWRPSNNSSTLLSLPIVDSQLGLPPRRIGPVETVFGTVRCTAGNIEIQRRHPRNRSGIRSWRCPVTYLAHAATKPAMGLVAIQPRIPELGDGELQCGDGKRKALHAGVPPFRLSSRHVGDQI